MSSLLIVPALVVLLTVLWPIPAPARHAEVPGPQPGASRQVLGYYVPYDPASWTSLQENATAIDIVGAQWVTIDPCGNLSSRDDQTLKQFARANRIRVFPSLLTSSGWLNHQLLTDQAVAARALQQIVDYVMAEGYDGFDLDLEAIDAPDRQAYTAFVAALGSALHARGKALALAVPAKSRESTTDWAGAYDYAALGSHADLITTMAYDYRGPWSEPGPVAPYDWVEQVLAFATSQTRADKILLGLAFYGYDWNVTSGTARSLSYSEAARLAQRYQISLGLDPGTRSVNFRYQAAAADALPEPEEGPPLQHEMTVREAPPCRIAEPAATPTRTPRPTPRPNAIQEHQVWLEESASAAARLELANRYQAGGVAAWRLGFEDPRMWTVLRQWRSGGS